MISPILSNAYLHEVLDEWFARQVVPRACRPCNSRPLSQMMSSSSSSVNEMHGECLMCCRSGLAKYGLTLHPEKTRLIDFRRPGLRVSASPDNNGDACSRPGTFDLLGFTHYWAKSRKGYWVVKQKTAADRFRRTLRRIAEWCRD